MVIRQYQDSLGLMVSARVRNLAVVVALVGICMPAVALACGGFFCSFQRPVNQVGEQILFAVEGSKVRAHIQIQYQGEAEDFSWVLPLPSVPDVDVGIDEIFTALRAVTDPRFEIEWQNEDGCEYTNNCCAMMEMSAGGSNEVDDGVGAVEVLKEGAVGPYNFQVVGSEDGEALFNWLNDNGYDQSPEAKDLVEYYVETDFVFIAVKLSKDQEAGDIRPLIVEYEAPNLACIPIRLTSIAAQADMPIFSWVLSDARAIPLNFFHVVLNPKAYDWMSCGIPAGQGDFCFGENINGVDCQQEYIKLVTEAADSAEGRGFVTEFAGATDVMEGALYTEGQYDLDKLKDLDDPEEFLQVMLQLNFPRFGALIQEIIRDNIPQPDASTLPENCQTETEFYSWNLSECLKSMPEDWTFDPAAFVADLDERFVTPMKDAQALFGKHPYMTRLFTTMSPDEMTRDPLFAFNSELGDVSNVHTIKAKATCSADNQWTAEAITLTFADGEEVQLEGPFQQCTGGALEGTSLANEPAAADIQVLSEDGAPQSIPADQIEQKDVELDRIPVTGATVTPNGSNGSSTGGTPNVEPSADAKKSSSDGCSAGSDLPEPLSIVFLLAGFFGVLILRRRGLRVPQS